MVARVRVGRLDRLLAKDPKRILPIVEAPATANRATRRAIGMFGSIWRWDTNGTEMQRTFVPRYIRRHYSADAATTRRQRRHAARILRISLKAGIV